MGVQVKVEKTELMKVPNQRHNHHQQQQQQRTAISVKGRNSKEVVSFTYLPSYLPTCLPTYLPTTPNLPTTPILPRQAGRQAGSIVSTTGGGDTHEDVKTSLHRKDSKTGVLHSPEASVEIFCTHHKA
ncbi:unnamed protein product [Heterobilharzia americana]|nr:unnamed protein product [Heterobilharzia americana]